MILAHTHKPTSALTNQKTQATPLTTPTSATSSLSDAPSTSTDIINDIIQGMIALSAIIGITLSFRENRRQTQITLEIANKQIKESSKQSQDALEASQSQSRASLDALREQTRLSKNQAQEAIRYQFRPIIVCTKSPNKFRGITVDMMNVGLGVAIDVWGVFSFRSTGENPPGIVSFANSIVFLPNSSEQVSFKTNYYDYILTHENEQIEGYSFYPQEYNGISYSNRLLITYSDAFNNKYLSIFDFNQEYGWKQIASQDTKRTLDEIILGDDLMSKQIDEGKAEDYLRYQAESEEERLQVQAEYENYIQSLPEEEEQFSDQGHTEP